MPEMVSIDFSEKIHTLENELTKFRYDALFRIDKTGEDGKKTKPKQQRARYQDDLRILDQYGFQPVPFDSSPSRHLLHRLHLRQPRARPKGVMVEHGSLVNFSFWHNRWFNVTTADHSPLFNGFGFDGFRMGYFPLPHHWCVLSIPYPTKSVLRSTN